MKLTRSELRTIYSWCVTYDHCKKNPAMEWYKCFDMEFPTGMSMKCIDDWWNTEFLVVLTDETIAEIVSAIIDNTGMEDARCPWDLVEKLRTGI